jgi:hypothetical protein
MPTYSFYNSFLNLILSLTYFHNLVQTFANINLNLKTENKTLKIHE